VYIQRLPDGQRGKSWSVVWICWEDSEPSHSLPGLAPSNLSLFW